jgi:hypothetical protein
VAGKFGLEERRRNEGRQELLGILGPLRSDIVEVESPATGTPLPQNYKNAAPLARV